MSADQNIIFNHFYVMLAADNRFAEVIEFGPKLLKITKDFSLEIYIIFLRNPHRFDCEL